LAAGLVVGFRVGFCFISACNIFPFQFVVRLGTQTDKQLS
jgi:hypothetical protein